MQVSKRTGKTRGTRRGIVVVLAIGMLAASCSGRHDTTKPSTTRATNTSPRASSLPPAPLPKQLSGSAAEQANVLAAALSAPGTERITALLAAYRDAAVPVVDPSGRSLTTPSAEIGVPWVYVYTAAIAPSVRTSVALSQVGLIFQGDAIMPVVDRSKVAADLLDGLRTALHGDATSPGVARAALLVQADARRTRGVDIADVAVTPDQVYVSGPVLSLLVAAGILTAATSRVSSGQSGPARLRRDTPNQALMLSDTSMPTGCSEGASAQWALWFMAKVLGGASFDGLAEWKGPFRALIEHLSTHVTTDLPVSVDALNKSLGKIASVSTWVTASLTLTTLLAAYLTFTGKPELVGGEPLVRTHSESSRGETKTLAVTVTNEYGEDVDASTINGINCLLTVLAIAGNDSTLTEAGPIPDVTVKFEGGEGFGRGLDARGRLVYLENASGVLVDTDANGVARTSISGAEQAYNIPGSAPPIERSFTVFLSAAAEGVGASSLAKTLFDSLLCAASPGIGCVSPLADIAKQFQWSLGEWRFALRDWKDCPDLTGVPANFRRKPGAVAPHQSEFVCPPPRLAGALNYHDAQRNGRIEVDMTFDLVLSVHDVGNTFMWLEFEPGSTFTYRRDANLDGTVCTTTGSVSLLQTIPQPASQKAVRPAGILKRVRAQYELELNTTWLLGRFGQFEPPVSGIEVCRGARNSTRETQILPVLFGFDRCVDVEGASVPTAALTPGPSGAQAVFDCRLDTPRDSLESLSLSGVLRLP